MNYMTISEVSAKFQISTRMLRYYEKMGMIESTRRVDYAYRIYDENAVKRVQQIIILRKLQIPLKKIRLMMNGSKEDAIGVLREQIRDMNASEKSIHTTKSVLERLLTLLSEDVPERNYMEYVQEEKVGNVMDEFVRSSKLYEKKPDARLFGFNHPDPEEGKDFCRRSLCGVYYFLALCISLVNSFSVIAALVLGESSLVLVIKPTALYYPFGVLKCAYKSCSI